MCPYSADKSRKNGFEMGGRKAENGSNRGHPYAIGAQIVKKLLQMNKNRRVCWEGFCSNAI